MQNKDVVKLLYYKPYINTYVINNGCNFYYYNIYNIIWYNVLIMFYS